MNVALWSDRIIRYGFYLLFALVPLLLTPWNYELFEYNKMMAVYGLTTLIVTAWIIKMVSEKEIKIARTPLDIPIALFLISQLLSSLFSMDPHVSWFGYYSRFNGGMFSIISYVLLYYAFVSNLTHWPNWTNLLKVALGSATVVALYGIAERLGVDKHLWVQDVQNRVFSTLGQPNWLAAYIVALAPMSIALAIQTQISKLKERSFGFWIYSLMALLFFTVLLFTRSRSGLAAFAIADMVFWTLLFVIPGLTRDPSSASKTGFRLGGRNDMKGLLTLHAAFALIIFFNGSNIAQIDKYFSFAGIRNLVTNKATTPAPASSQTGPLLEVGGTESGTIRKYVWQGALTAWKSSPKTITIGTGTETFAFAFYKWRPIAHNLTSEWDFLYNKAHNEYLNYLATTGVFGLGSYLLFIGTFIFWFVRKVSSTNYELRTINLALFAGWLSILITNFFGFSVVIVQIFLFLFPAMIISASSKLNVYTKKLVLPYWALWAISICGVLLFGRISSFWYADTLYATGYRQARNNQFAAANSSMERTIAMNPGEPAYRDEIANTLAALSVAAFEAQNATLSAQFARAALAQNDRAIRISAANVNFWKTRTKIYYALSAFDPALNPAAITALEKASELSPNDPKIYYNLAILYGREEQNDKAVEMLNRAITLKPNYRDGYYALYVFYMEIKRPADARAALSTYLTTVDPNDTNFREILDKSTP